MSHRVRGRWVVGGCVALCLACASVAHASFPDTWVTAKVKMALITSPGVGGPINVDTDDGRVTLHGEVATADEKREAERVASEVPGVHGIRNLLQIVPPSRKKEIRVQDAALEKRVRSALENVPNLKGVKVKSVHRGFVLIGGRTERLSDHLQALELVANVEGVRQVASDAQNPDPAGEKEIGAGEETLAAAMPGTRGDAWITIRAKLRLMTDPEIAGRDIHVDTYRGQVVLFGSVSSPALRRKASVVAAGIPGVRAVRNQLEIVPSPNDPDEALAQDEAVAEAVRRRLSEAAFAGSSIDVEVKTSVARLTGSVQNEADRAAAVRIASSTGGISSVQDDLRVGSSAGGR